MKTYTALYSNGAMIVTDKPNRREAKRFMKLNRETNCYLVWEGYFEDGTLIEEVNPQESWFIADVAHRSKHPS